MEPLAALEHLHLVKDGQMTHAGAWLLADDITRYSLQAGVTCAVLRGVTKTQILNLKNFTGDLYTIYEDCVAYAQAKAEYRDDPAHLGPGTNGSSFRRKRFARRW